MESRLIVTEDGSHTIFQPELQEHYHSVHGAISESKHVYIEAAMQQFSEEKTLTILEVGFGTGLNALLTLVEAIKRKQKVRYVALEPFPLSSVFYEKLNFGELTGFPDAHRYLQQMHQKPWNFPYYYSDYFLLHKLDTTLEDASLQNEAFDVVYFDAFAPGKQPGVWSTGNFRKCCDAMKHGGVLTTYSSQGQVKRNMQDAGLTVEKIPGPTGKREIIRAIKPKV